MKSRKYGFGMEALKLEELKKISLSVLKEIDKVCAENGFRYTLLAGTLLGAVRHKGFIPWDDDIDIAMPREDYKKFVKYCCENETAFKLLSVETDDRYAYIFAKACDKSTYIVEDVANPQNIDFGVYVDIFPIDGLGMTYEEAKKEFRKTRFKRELLVAKNWRKFFRSKTKSLKYEPIRLAFYILSRFVKSKALVYSVQKRIESKDLNKCEYAGIVGSTYREREIMKREIYDEFTKIAFEDSEFSVISKYDEYLKTIYGEYMKLPPEEKRVTHHMFKAYKKS